MNDRYSPSVHARLQAERALPDARTIYVGHVDADTRPHQLASHFTDCGAVARVAIVCDAPSGARRARQLAKSMTTQKHDNAKAKPLLAFAYVAFRVPADARTAVARSTELPLLRGLELKVIARGAIGAPIARLAAQLPGCTMRHEAYALGAHHNGPKRARKPSASHENRPADKGLGARAASDATPASPKRKAKKHSKAEVMGSATSQHNAQLVEDAVAAGTTKRC